MTSAGTIYVYTTPAYRRTRWLGRRRGRGLVKVGYTTRDPHVRIREQIGASSPEKDPYDLLMTASATTRSGRHITDKHIHAQLRAMGFVNVHNEWFECGAGDVRTALVKLSASNIRKGSRAPSRRRTRKQNGVRHLAFASLAIAGFAFWLIDPNGALWSAGKVFEFSRSAISLLGSLI